MSAIITDDFRRKSVDRLITDNTNEYYIGIGKSDPHPDIDGVNENSFSYTVPAPEGSAIEVEDARNNLFSMSKINVSERRALVPRVNFELGAKYKVYDPGDPDTFFATSDSSGETILPCYVYDEVNDSFFLCLRNGGGASPSLTSVTIPSNASPIHISDGDGYVWAFVSELEDNSDFKTAQFLAVIDDSDPDSIVTSGGMFYGVSVIDPGESYSDASAKFIGKRLDSSGDEELVEVDLSVAISNDVITHITIPDDLLINSYELGILSGSIVISSNSGSGASAIPRIAPINGFSFAPKNVLPTFFAGITTDINGDSNGDALILPYREISIIQNPEFAVDSDNDTTTANCLRWFQVNDASLSLNISSGDTMKYVHSGGGTSNEVATKVFFDAVEVISGNTRVYYHTNSSPDVVDGSLPASGGTILKSSDDTQLFVYDSIEEPEFIRNSGSIVFVESRKPIIRSASQVEKIQLIIQY